MDSVLAEALEILDCDNIRTSSATVKKGKKIVEAELRKHKSQKKFLKKKIEEKQKTNVRLGLRQKYKENTKVGIIYKKGKKEERDAHKQRVLHGLRRIEAKTDIEKWCKLTGSKFLGPKEEEEEDEESAFDDALFEKFEKEYLENRAI